MSEQPCGCSCEPCRSGDLVHLCFARRPALPPDVDEYTDEERAELPAGPAYQWATDVRP